MNTRKPYKLSARICLTVLILPVLIPTMACASQSIADLPDPTRPLGSSVKQTGDFRQGIRLQSILLSNDRKSTVINGYIRYVGSHVNGGRIVDIRHDAVVINYHGHLYTLHLDESKSVSQRGTGQ